MKKKYLRANKGEFMTKELNKAIMTRSRLRNDYLKKKSGVSKIAYDKQKKYCVNLLRILLTLRSVLYLIIRSFGKLLNQSSRIKSLIKKQLI